MNVRTVRFDEDDAAVRTAWQSAEADFTPADHRLIERVEQALVGLAWQVSNAYLAGMLTMTQLGIATKLGIADASRLSEPEARRALWQLYVDANHRSIHEVMDRVARGLPIPAVLGAAKLDASHDGQRPSLMIWA